MYNRQVVWSEEQNEWVMAKVDPQTGEVYEYAPLTGKLDDMLYGDWADQEVNK